MRNIGNEIIEGLEEAVEIMTKRGRKSKSVSKDTVTVKPVKEHTPQNIKRFRTKLGMSTSVFANVLGSTQKTVQAWESGSRKPAGSALRLLTILEKHPEIVNDFLKEKK